ncbi:hypothetical protein [Nocardia cyriacigeorgica]|uniref:hypothetical protein n=1 Tax=Nocardia cyriacigeorgica TaxID=135487 RepID=UPI0024568681|nr:hypothetical protein [Nocardia cyriacigeorgica]
MVDDFGRPVAVRGIVRAAPNAEVYQATPASVPNSPRGIRLPDAQPHPRLAA